MRSTLLSSGRRVALRLQFAQGNMSRQTGLMGFSGLLALVALPALAQLPPPPASPAPVVNLEYDAHGNPTRTVLGPDTPGLNLSTSHGYDRLHRKQQTTDARSGVTRLGYNGREDVVQVTDPRNLVTWNLRNGLGDSAALVSPDTGTAGVLRDAAGNVLYRQDSRGVLATHSYDTLNRLTSTVFTQAGQNTQAFNWFYDQTGPGFNNGVGRLTSTTAPGGATRHTYDAQGRITNNTLFSQGTGGAALVHSTSYTYDAAGHVVAITYPSGRVLSMAYVGGQPSSLSLASSSTSTPQALASQLVFEPFGALRSWQWHMNAGLQSHERAFDTSGRMVRYPLATVVRDISYDAADRISSYRHLDRSSGAASAGAQALDQAFAYDELGRLTVVVSGVGPTAQVWGYGYDANGNRTYKVFSANAGGSYVIGTHVLANDSNRLLSISEPARVFSHDAAGNTLTALSSINDVQAQGLAKPWAASWSLSGRLEALLSTTDGTEFLITGYAYDAFGQRVR
jgi:YD repeat-containing protein